MPKPTAIEIGASYSGKIANKQFENRNPYFSVTETYTESLSDEFIQERQHVLHAMCKARFLEVERDLLAPKSQYEALASNSRIYKINGKKYPSVTTILRDHQKFYVSDEALVQLAARGRIVHKQCEIFINDGIWKYPKDIPEVAKELKIILEGDAKLSLEGFNFPAFRRKYIMETINTEQKVKNDKLLYAGTQDWKCTYQGKITICDFKCGKTVKDFTFEQLSAYAKCEGNEDVEQLCIIYLGGNQQGFSAPVTTTNIDNYFNEFKQKREIFRNKYGM